MKYLFLILLAISHNTYALAFEKTKLLPSKELLSSVGVKEYEIDERVLLKLETCENPSVVPLSILLHHTKKDYKNYKLLKVAVESIYYKTQKLMFTLKNEGGLTETPYASVRIDIREPRGTLNLWAFYFSDNKVIANATETKCAWSH